MNTSRHLKGLTPKANSKSHTMNLKYLIAVSMAWLSLVGVTHAVKVDLPGEAENKSSNIVTGAVTAIYSKITRDSSYEWNHCVAAVRIEKIDKGDGLKAGDLIYVRYIAGTKWIGKGMMPPGPGGHNNVPAEGEKRKICLTKNPDGGFDVYYVSGFKMPDEKKP
jgi:hypothetical protein